MVAVVTFFIKMKILLFVIICFSSSCEILALQKTAVNKQTMFLKHRLFCNEIAAITIVTFFMKMRFFACNYLFFKEL